MTRSILSQLLPALTALAAGAGLLFLIVAVRRNSLPYNSEGNYFDGVVNYHEHMVVFYGVLAGASFSGALMSFAIRWLLKRSQTANPR